MAHRQRGRHQPQRVRREVTGHSTKGDLSPIKQAFLAMLCDLRFARAECEFKDPSELAAPNG